MTTQEKYKHCEHTSVTLRNRYYHIAAAPYLRVLHRGDWGKMNSRVRGTISCADVIANRTKLWCHRHETFFRRRPPAQLHALYSTLSVFMQQSLFFGPESDILYIERSSHYSGMYLCYFLCKLLMC